MGQGGYYFFVGRRGKIHTHISEIQIHFFQRMIMNTFKTFSDTTITLANLSRLIRKPNPTMHKLTRG